MTRANLTEYQVEVIVDRLRSGWTRRAIAADMGLTRPVVERAGAVHGMAGRPVVPHGRRHDTLRGPDLSWMEQAKCRGLSDPTKSPDRRHFTEWPVNEQVAVCLDGCPVRMECLDYGLRGPLGYSRANEVFGGLSPRRLAALQRQRLESVAS